MTDAGGTNKVIQLSNCGSYMLYMVYNTEVSNGETIPIDGTDGVPGIQAEDKVFILSGANLTDETQIGGATVTCEYGETEMHFTWTDAGASDDDVAIVFMYVPQGDPFIGAA